MFTTLMAVHAPPPKKTEATTLAFSDATAGLRPLVRAVIASMLRENRAHPDVEDCTHEALRRAFEGRARLRENDALRPWVLGIARHVALDTLRARRRDRARLARDASSDEGEAGEPLDRVADSAPGADERFARAERDRELAQALKELPEGQRKALVLFHGEGLQYQEIAQRLGVPLGTVATWVTRARKSVAEIVRSRAQGEWRDA